MTVISEDVMANTFLFVIGITGSVIAAFYFIFRYLLRKFLEIAENIVDAVVQEV